MKKLLVILSILFLVSCADKYNVQLSNNSIVEAVNDINTYKYTVGDTVCIYYSNAFQKWYFCDDMKDTVYINGGYYKYNAAKSDSQYIPLVILQYKIGVIK